MRPSGSLVRGRWATVWLGLSVTLLAWFTYVRGYQHPRAFFWDENYHVPSAQRYLHGTFFMEPHPPLGKLVIALGEALVSPEANGADDQLVGTEHAREAPAGFSFAGYRLLPTLFAWLVAPLLFAVFLLLVKRRLLAALLTLPYVFDNALIVHSRGAMLEPTLELFAVSMILLFLVLLEWREHPGRRRVVSLLLGACFAAVVTTKLNGLVMLLLYPALLWKLWHVRDRGRAIRDAAVCNLLGFAVVFVAVWQTHFALAATVHPSLPDGGYYQASAEYRRILAAGENGSLAHFGVMLRDSLRFVEHYERGVPALDLCKSDETGSPWFLWPIGARAINYRWETPGGGEEAPYRYLYLQSNPAAWAFGLAGVLVAAALLVGSLLLPLRRPLENRFPLAVFLGLWVGYMAAIAQVDRVMYLYHYFLPLLFSYILAGLAVAGVGQIAGRPVRERHRVAAVALCALAIIGTHAFYRPLTYYQPITDAAFERRALLRLWDLRCVRCEPASPLVQRTCS